MPLIRKPAAPQQVAVSLDVLQALSSGNPDERWSAARAAVDIPGGIDALAAALQNETDPRVREAILTSLSRADSAQSIQVILPLLRSDDASTRAGAVDALQSMTSAVRQCLPALLRDDDRDVRILSCELARSLPSEEATQLLCALLVEDTDANVCAAAIEVLTEVGNATALPVLAQCAGRFTDTPFLAFAIKIATDSILSQPARHD
jgi:HEAT repeat protein